MIFLIFITLFSTCFAYDDDVFRHIAMPAAAAAYSDNPNECWKNIKQYVDGTPNITIYRQYSVRCDSLNDTCSAYIATEDYTPQGIDDFVIYIAFRGTNNYYAFFENGWKNDELVPFIIGGKVSKTFFDAFNSIWNAGMKDDIYALKNKHPSVYFYAAGHSIGGAMAALAAATLEKLGIGGWLYTFGQPRTGDRNFARAFIHLQMTSFRIIHNADIVPHLTPFNKVLYHHIYEDWYNNSMGVDDTDIFCRGPGENPKCSNSLNASAYNMEDHKNYFGRDFIEYGKSGCPDLKTSEMKKIKISNAEFLRKPYRFKGKQNIKL